MTVAVGNVVFQISADLKNLQSQLRTMEGNFQQSFGRIDGIAKSFGAGLLQGIGGGLSVGALTSFAKQVVDLAGHLKDLEGQTGISARTLSGLKSTLEQNGTTVDAFAKGIFNAQKVLGQVDDEGAAAARAVKALGLNLNELRNANPDRFLELVAGALAKVENPMDRAALGAALLGKSFKELSPALAAISADFERLKNSGMTDEQLRRLDQFGDSITKLSNSLQILAAVPLSTVAKIFSVITGSATESDAAAERLSQVTAKIAAIDRDLSKLAGATDPVLVKRAEVMKAQLAVLGAQQAALEKAAGKGISAPSDPARFKNLLGGAKSADEAKKIADAIAEQNNRLEIQLIELTQGKQAAEDYALKQQELKEAAKGLTGEIVHEQDRRRALTEQIREQTAAYAQLKALVDATRGGPLTEDIRFGLTAEESAEALKANSDFESRRLEAQQELAELRRQLRIGAIDTSTPQGREQQRVEMILADFEKTKAAIENLGHAARLTQEEIAQVTVEAWKKANVEIRGQIDEITAFQTRAFERMQDAFGDLFKDALSGEIKSLADAGKRIQKVLNDIVAEWLGMQLKVGLLGDKYGQRGGELGGAIGWLFGGRRLPTGVGERPAGTEGPLLPNGGFYDLENVMRAGGPNPIAEIFRQGAPDAQQQLNDIFTKSTDLFGGMMKNVVSQISLWFQEIFASTSSSGGGGGMGGLPGMDMFGSLFGGGTGSGGSLPFTEAWASAANEGVGTSAGSAASSFDWSSLFSWFSFAHSGGAVRHGGAGLPKRRVRFMHSGGEVPAMLKAGEYVFNDWTTSRIKADYGAATLDRINATGELPMARGGSSMTAVNVHIHGATNPNEFKLSQPQWSSAIARAVKRGMKEL